MSGAGEIKYDAGVTAVDGMDKILPGVWLGSLAAAQDDVLLKLSRVRVLLTLGANLPVASGLESVVVEIEDKLSEDMLPVLHGCIDAIRRAIEGRRGIMATVLWACPGAPPQYWRT